MQDQILFAETIEPLLLRGEGHESIHSRKARHLRRIREQDSYYSKQPSQSSGVFAFNLQFASVLPDVV